MPYTLTKEEEEYWLSQPERINWQDITTKGKGGIEMEVMAVPNKELLIFYNQIHEWVDQVYPDQDRPTLSFKKDTPQSILDLFDSIKSKIGFDYAL